MSSPAPQLTDPWRLGQLEVPNRVLLAPLAGIGNWFVRLQAKRHGAGMAVSEMVSSHAIHYRNERTLREIMRIHPDERRPGAGGVPAPTAIQLFGQDPAVMRLAAGQAVFAGADAIDINMGCPVPKVCRTGSGAALLDDPARAVAVAGAAREGAQEGLERRVAAASADGLGTDRAHPPHPGSGAHPGSIPVTVKLRSGRRPGDISGFDLAQRLVHDAGVAAIGFHPRSAAVHHKGTPDYALAARLVQTLPAPVILTGGLSDPAHVRAAFAETGVAAVMLARGCLGNPWLFEQVLGLRTGGPTRAEVQSELRWVMDRAAEHLGPERATRYLRKFYPWYVARLELDRTHASALQQSLHAAADLAEARLLLAEFDGVDRPAVLAA